MEMNDCTQIGYTAKTSKDEALRLSQVYGMPFDTYLCFCGEYHVRESTENRYLQLKWKHAK